MYKNLNLNRENLINCINEYCKLNYGTYEVDNKMEEKGPTRRRLNLKIEGNEIYMDFHYNFSKGTTTIDLSGGNEKEIKTSIAEFIINSPKCMLSEDKSKIFIAKGIKYEDFNALIEIIKQSEFFDSQLENKIGEIVDVYKFIGKYNEKLVINYYKTTNKIMLQGKPLLLFNDIMCYITELIDLEEIPKVFNEYNDISVDKSNVSELLNIHLPNSYDKINPKMKKVLMQAMYNYTLEGNLFDYTYLVFPALRVLEGHIKLRVKEYNIPLGTYESIICFKEENQEYVFKKEYINNISCIKKRTNLENAYTFYHSQRHTLFHWNSEELPMDMTRTIENIGEVRQIILSTFKLIDEYYAM